MDGVDILNSIQTTFFKTDNSESLDTVLLLLKEHNVLDYVFKKSEDESYNRVTEAKKCCTTWVDKINEQLNASQLEKKVVTGLVLLLETMFDITYEKYIKFYEKWFDKILKFISNKGNSSELVGKAILAGAQLILTGMKWPDLRREVLKDTCLSAFFNMIIKTLEERTDIVTESLYAISILLKSTNNNKLRSQFEKLVKLCFSILNDNVDDKTLNEVLVCLVLATDNPAGLNFILDQAIYGIHDLVNLLYRGFETENETFLKTMESVRPYVLKELWSMDSLSAALKIPAKIIISKIEVLTKCLISTFGGGYSFNSKIPLDQIFYVIYHLLLLDGSQLKKKNSLELAEFLHVIPKLHICGLQLLDSLVLNFGASLLPYCSKIIDICLLEIRMSRNPLCIAMQNIELKLCLYAVVRQIIRLYKGASLEAARAMLTYALEDLEIISEATYFISKKSSNLIEMTESVETTKRKRAQTHVKERISTALTSTQESDQSKIRSSIPDPLRIGALNLIIESLNSLGGTLDNKIMRKIELTLLYNFISVYRSNVSPLWDKFCFPEAFSNALIRTTFFEALTASILSNSRHQSSLLPYAIRFFNAGISDPSQAVSQIASRGLSIAYAIIHPRVPILNPKLSKEAITNYLDLETLDEAFKESEAQNDDEEMMEIVVNTKKVKQLEISLEDNHEFSDVGIVSDATNYSIELPTDVPPIAHSSLVKQKTLEDEDIGLVDDDPDSEDDN